MTISPQILRVDGAGARSGGTVGTSRSLPLPPVLAPRMEFDGYRVIRELRGSYRQPHLSGERPRNRAAVVLKLPSTIDQRG